MYFAYYIYYGILFLSILVNTDIAAKSSIQFVSQRNNNIIRSFENVSTTSRKQRMLYIKDYDFTYKRNLWFSSFIRLFHYQKCCILPGAEALSKCRKPWQMDVCQEFCQEQNHQHICSSQMNLPGLQLLANALLAQALAQPLANCV